jgi:hypothetical protein
LQQPNHSARIQARRTLFHQLVAAGVALAAGGLASAADSAEVDVPPALHTMPCCEIQADGFLADPTLDSEANYLTLQFDAEVKDGRGLWRDTLYFAGYQFAAVAILYAMPEDVTGWSVEDKQNYSMSKWWNNITEPQMDSDDFYLNWVVHPYWGASYFVRARERGYSNMQSFWYSTLLSTMFEFGAEALAEEPSYQDIVLTPALGSLLGAWFMQVREGERERSDLRGYRSTSDKWIWVLTDPLGSLNHQVDKLFRVDADISVRPFFATSLPFEDPYARPYSGSDDEVVGLNLQLNW